MLPIAILILIALPKPSQVKERFLESQKATTDQDPELKAEIMEYSDNEE